MAVFGGSYLEILKKINTFFKTFDQGYYGRLDIKDGVLYDYYKNGTQSSLAIADYNEAKVISAGTKVAIDCKGGTSCVTGYNGSKFDNMPFSSEKSFDAQGLADDLNALVRTYRSGSLENNEMASSGIGAGTRVRILESDDHTAYIGRTGIVKAIRPSLEGWYVGSIKMDDGALISFRKVKLERY